MQGYWPRLSPILPKSRGYIPRLCLTLTMLFLFLSGRPLSAQFGDDDIKAKDIQPTDVIHWRANTASIDTNGVVEVALQLTTEQSFSIYVEQFKILALGDFDLMQTLAPDTTRIYDDISKKEVEVYTGGDFRFYFKPRNPTPAPTNIIVEVTFVGCTGRICLFPYTQQFPMQIYAASAPFNLDTAQPSSKSAAAEEGLESQFADRIKRGEFSFWMLVLVVFLGGLATNLTPCVAPMIPITIRLLAKQKFSPTLNASLYALGIMVTYTLLGTAATFSGKAFGTFMSLPSVNLAFALVMMFLGLSMLGFADLSVLQNLGSRLGSGKPSAKNTFLMGAGAGLVAAPCTGPVLGALLTYSAGQSNPILGIILMAAYSFGFSLPYIFLGRAAASVTKIRVSPVTQIATKLIFAAVMFGLTFYYLRIPLYRWLLVAKPYWSILAASFAGVGGIALLICVISPSLQNRKYLTVIPCFLFGFGIFSSWQAYTTKVEDLSTINIVWHKSLDAALSAARESGKPILMDNWAEWCEACKKMDKTTFVDESVLSEIATNWTLVKLDLTEGTTADDEHLSKYGITGLPTLVLLPADGDLTKKSNIVGYVNAAGLLNRLRDFNKGK